MISHLSRTNKTAAYTGPFLVFMVLLQICMSLKSTTAGASWWRSHPEHWLYPVQTLVCLGLIVWWWKNYDFGRVSVGTIGFGLLVGTVGFVLWVLPGWLYSYGGAAAWGLPDWLAKGLGIVSRHSDKGFNPDIFPQGSAAYFSSLGFRFLRMVVAVAFLEELFWRGFLWRYLVDQDKPFWKIPFGVVHKWSLVGTIALFTMQHSPHDWAACLVYGILISWVAIRTRSLAACVACHAITNLLLGIYTLKTGLWGYW
jgi:membrane protease YdiL (CAAX protease family)